MGDEREMGRLEAKVDFLIESVKSMESRYVTKAEYEPRISALETTNHKVWDKVVAVSSLGSLVVAAIALFRTLRG